MPVISVIGCITSYAYQEAKLLADDIQECSREYAKRNPTFGHSVNELIIHCNGMIDKQWQLYERNQTYRSLRPFNPTPNHSDYYEPILVHSQLGYIGGRKELLAFAQKTYQFSLDPGAGTSASFNDLCVAIRRLIDADLATYITEQREKHNKLFAAIEFEIDEAIGINLTQSSRFRSVYQSSNQSSSQPINVNDRRKRLIFELDSSSCPRTCQNFLALCEGLHQQNDGSVDVSKSSNKQPSLHYKQSPIHRIVPNGYLQGGDVVAGRGDGVASMYGVNHTFPDECLLDANTVKTNNLSSNSRSSRAHDFVGCLSMANAGRPHSNASQFLVTLGPMPSFDGKYVPFGQLIDGFDLLHVLNQSVDIAPSQQKAGSDRIQLRRQRPAFPIVVSESGEFHEDLLTDQMSSWVVKSPVAKQSINQSTDQPLSKVTLLVVGPESAGKSTLVSLWCGAPPLRHPAAASQPLIRPTVGFELDRLKGVHDMDLSIFGLGGAANIKGYWSSYYDAAFAVAFVVDSGMSGEAYWETTRADLQAVCHHAMISGKPVFVVANVRTATGAPQCASAVASRLMHPPQFVVECDAGDGRGVQEALDTILGATSPHLATLETRVKVDVEQRKREAREVMERRRQERESEAQQAAAKIQQEEAKVGEQVVAS